MVLLIDTNIILDVLLSRSDFVKESSIIWKLCETEQAKGNIKAQSQKHSLSNPLPLIAR